MTDRELLIAYQRHRSADDLAQLVSRHVDLVYSVARRHAKDSHLAEDITQEVFLTFARKADRLPVDVPLAGWLFTTARLLSLQSLRAAARRNRHETEAAMSHKPPPSPDPTWSLIAEDIDKAVADLPPTDRDALLLRYFSGKSNPEIAATLAISDEAAKKRVQRALDALQKLLTSRGLAGTSALTALTLAAALTSHAVQAAPPALASSITTALTSKAAATVATKGTLMAAAKFKAVLIASAAVVAITASVVTAVHLSKRDAPVTTAAPSDPVTPAPADAPIPSPVTNSAASEDFLAAYALPPGQAIANLPNINPAARAALYQQKAARDQVAAIQDTPSAMIVQWKDDQLSLWGMSFDGVATETVPLNTILDIYAPEIVSPLAMPAFPGDIVFRADATEDEYIASLRMMLSTYFKRPVDCSVRTQVMDAIVLTGKYNFTPVADAPATRQIGKRISFYLHAIDTIEGAGGGRCDSVREFAGTLSEYLHRPVVIDSPNFPKHIYYWLNRDVSRASIVPEDIDTLLRHIAEQTGLTVSHETRPVRCLVIAAQGDAPAAGVWKGWTARAYPAVSPFQAVRWNGDAAEVQVNGTWYQLLAVNDLSADQIITSAKSADREWQRRFEEDFVALLAYMGHEPGPTVTLKLKNLETQKEETLTDVAMTEENRRAILRARHPAATAP
jgi:RNA polymerase sigma factor (sigma-70 family)